MQGARDYEMQFNNILKKEEYRKYDAYNQSFCFNYFCVLEDILTNTFQQEPRIVCAKAYQCIEPLWTSTVG